MSQRMGTVVLFCVTLLLWVGDDVFGSNGGPSEKSNVESGVRATLPESDASEILRKSVELVQAAYKGLETFSADFAQTSTLASLGHSRTDSGTLRLKRNGKMRWDFLEPEVRHFISDGRKLWIFTPSDKQVMVTSLQEGASQTALNFMFGLGDIRKDFDVSLPEDTFVQKPGLFPLKLVPRETIGTIKSLTILVSEEDGMVREALVNDHMGNVTRLVFSNLKINGPIEDSLFVFEKPEGVVEIQTPVF